MHVFISEVKKENSTKKKNEHGDICFLVNYKFLCKNSFKLTSFLFLYLHCVTFFILDLNDFLVLMIFYKKDFSLKNKLRAFSSLFFCVLLLANSMQRIRRKKYGISHF